MSKPGSDEFEKTRHRDEIKEEFGQLIDDFSCRAAQDQAAFEGTAHERPPRVLGCVEEDEKPCNVVFAVNLTNKNFVANADTIDRTFCLDGSVEVHKARQFLGVFVDMMYMYHAVSQKVTLDNLQPTYRQKGLFNRKTTNKLQCDNPTVQGFMECISLPRDLYNNSHDTFVRLWFTAIRSPLHVTQEYNCLPFSATLSLHQYVSEQKGEPLLLTAQAYINDWGDFHRNYDNDESFVRASNPRKNLGLTHPEVFANPRSKYFSTVQDRKELQSSIPDDEDKAAVLLLRKHMLRLVNNPDSYLQEDSVHGLVFRPHNPNAFYKMPSKMMNVERLPSEMLGIFKTPAGIEKRLPQHVKLCDTHLLIHKRAANKKHYENLRDLLPVHTRRVKVKNQWNTELTLQVENITPEGYLVLWVPSTIRRSRVCTRGGLNSGCQHLFDLMDPNLQGSRVVLSRYDTKIPRPVEKYSPNAQSNAVVAAAEEEPESDAYDSSVSLDEDAEMFDDVEGASQDDDMDERYSKFLLAVHRFMKGHTGKSLSCTHVPVWVWEKGENGSMKPFSEVSELEEATGVCVEIPYFPDWVEAHRAANAIPENTDPQLIQAQKTALNRHVTESCQFLKSVLSRTRFQTKPVCITRIAESYVNDEQGRRRTEPDVDASGNLVMDENGEIRKRFVVRQYPVRVGVHYIRPMPSNILYKKSKRSIIEYCKTTTSANEKPLPILFNEHPKHTLYQEEYLHAKFDNTAESSAHTKCWWEKKRYPVSSGRPMDVENMKLCIENGITGELRGVSSGPDYTRAEYSTTQGALIENRIRFLNNEMGISYLQDLGNVWVKMVAKAPNPEYYVKKSIQPWFSDTYELDNMNNWRVKSSVHFPEILRLDPDHHFEDVIEIKFHSLFDHVGGIFNQYKYCHLVYATFGTAFRKPESYELAASANSTAVSLKFVGDTSTGKSHKCNHILCFFNKERHVLDEQGNSALCGLGVMYDYRECVISYSDESNEDKDAETLRQEKIMQTQGFISRGRSAKIMCQDGVERYMLDYTSNRANEARVALVNEEAKGGENVKANEDRALKIYAQESRVAFMKPKKMHGAKCRTLKSTIMEQHFQDSRVAEAGRRALGEMEEHTERLACMETFITTLPSEARDVEMDVAHIRWKGIAKIMTEKGVVWNDRPRLYQTMLQLARFKSVEMATLAAFEGQRREDGSKIPFTPENYWEIIPYMYATERTACKIFHYCATESLGVAYNFPVMNSLFLALVRHKHNNRDEDGVRKRFIQSEKYDPGRIVVVYKMKKKRRTAYFSEDASEHIIPAELKKKWGEIAQTEYGINKTKHDFKKDWQRLKKSKNSLADWKVRPQRHEDGNTIEYAEATSEHTVFTFPGLSSDCKTVLPIIEKVDENIEKYKDDKYLDAITVEVVKGSAPTMEGDPDYSHEEYAVVQISVACLKYTIEQRHATENRGDMEKEDIIEVVKEFEKVDKNLIKKCFIEVCSCKNNMVDPCQHIINQKRSAYSKKIHKSTAEDSRNPLYYRQRVPGMRYKKCQDDGKKIPYNYRVMTIAEPPTYHGGEVLNPAIANTLVITENKNNVQTFYVDAKGITTTAAGIGSHFYDCKKVSKKIKKNPKPLKWNIDIRAHYEKFLKIAHETTGILRGTPWAYKEEWTDSKKRKFFCKTYCSRFPPYSVLVHNFPTDEEAGHTPQNQLAEYIDASRRSERKRKHPQELEESSEDEEDYTKMFDDWGYHGDEQEDAQVANSQEAGDKADFDDESYEHEDKRQRLFTLGSENAFNAIDCVNSVDDLFGDDQSIPKVSMTLQEMMDAVGDMDAAAEKGVLPAAVQAVQSGDEEEDLSHVTYYGDDGLGPNPFVDRECAGEEDLDEDMELSD